ncbi:MAG: NAD(P)H-dependent oxidoreductase [Veillonella sp.]|nr:NAD(P)H-dependent oxidoreductase [Veillonella sp.]
MKRWIVVMLTMVGMLLAAGCGSSGSSSSGDANKDQGWSSGSGSQQAQSSQAPEGVQKGTGDGKTIVVYFSATGNTKTLATKAAKVLGADLYAITPAQPYTAKDLDYQDNNSRTSKERDDKNARPAIKGTVDLKPYTTVVLAYPIWWYEAPRIMNTFVSQVDLSGKKVIPIATSGGSGIGQSANILKDIGSPSAKWTQGRVFSPSVSDDELGQWLKAQ